MVRAHWPYPPPFGAVASRRTSPSRHERIAPWELEGELADFESAQGVKLPIEYRTFILRYGDVHPDLRSFRLFRNEGQLYQPSPLDPSKGRDDYDDDLHLLRGALPLTDGARRAVLVVSGVRRGQVLSVDLRTWTSEVLEHVTAGALGFLAWYDAWSQARLRHPELPIEALVERIGLSLKGSEDDLIEILDDIYADEHHRLKAIVGLVELGAPSPRVMDALDRAAEDPSPRVRLEALRGHHWYARDLFYARASSVLREDRAPQLRRATLTLLEQRSDPRRLELCRIALTDSDAEVVARAVRGLLEHGTDDLELMLLHPRVRSEPAALSPVLEAVTETRDPRWVVPLLDLVSHPRVAIREAATQALAALRRSL